MVQVKKVRDVLLNPIVIAQALAIVREILVALMK